MRNLVYIFYIFRYISKCSCEIVDGTSIGSYDESKNSYNGLLGHLQSGVYIFQVSKSNLIMLY